MRIPGWLGGLLVGLIFTMLGLVLWGVTLQDILNALPGIVKALGFVCLAIGLLVIGVSIVWGLDEAGYYV